MKLIQQHPSFKEDPFTAMKKHLEFVCIQKSNDKPLGNK
jgi:hypothetical protein